jgi:hypothetical protein
MKTFLTALTIAAAPALALAAEPLYVPHGDYAYAQPGVPQIQPLPETQFGSPSPQFGGSLPVMPAASPVIESYPLVAPPVSGPLVPLYPNVKVKSAHLAWPGGVSEVVQVPNPLPRSGCCDPVYVQICVPPGCQPIVSYGPQGQRVTYAFGGYRVVVTSLRGVVTVDYDRKG